MQTNKKFLTPSDYIQQDMSAFEDFDDQKPMEGMGDDRQMDASFSDSFYSQSFKN
jgi:hypothetical protein